MQVFGQLTDVKSKAQICTKVEISDDIKNFKDFVNCKDKKDV
jgi:hypothetical protein